MTSKAFTSFAPGSLLKHVKLVNGEDPGRLAVPRHGNELVRVLHEYASQAEPNEAVVALALADRIAPRLAQ